MINKKIDIEEWVNDGPNTLKPEFRQAVHIILHAIANSQMLRELMIMKGGVLLTLKYGGTRFTQDIDFSTNLKFVDFNEEQFKD